VYLLDTDHMSVLDRGGAQGEALRSRLRTVPPDEVATTSIRYEEQTRGWLARVAQARGFPSQVELYGYLKNQLLNYCVIAVLDFDDRAVVQCERLRQARIRIGTMDLKIAAIALANDATLLSRNLADFGKVPTLRVEDWTL
jgi:tRNA(fMet)-specific endonuclease VapC